MNILAIDPGKTVGWVCYDPGMRIIHQSGHGDWQTIALAIRAFTYPYTLALEWPDAYGSLPQADLYDTLFDAGRLVQAIVTDVQTLGRFVLSLDKDLHKVSRRAVKKHLLGRVSGTDAMLRAALVAEFGEGSDKPASRCQACKGRGKIRNVPCGVCVGCGKAGRCGALSSLSGSHEWAALAVAVTFAAREVSDG